MSKKLTLQPLHDRVLITAPPPEAKKEKVIGGIYIPDVTSNATRAEIDPPHMIVEVIAVGEACKLVKAGNTILVRKPNCFVVEITGHEGKHTMIREADVVAIVK